MEMEKCWLFVSLALLLSSLLPFCTSKDALLPGESISANQTLISSGGNFALGFFKPENSTKYFLGIWYNSIPDGPIVWVANRECPLDSPGVFMLKGDGNLVVLERPTSKVAIWNTSVPAMSSTTGVVMDSGNFVVISGEDRVLWESFDHPFDTLLPGMRLSVNRRTGEQRRLTSSVAPNNPQPGTFTLGIDPQMHAGQTVIWKKNAPHWRSSVYVGKGARGAFNNASEIFVGSYNFDDDNEVYFSYALSSSSLKLRIVLTSAGQIEVLLWQGLRNTWSLMMRLPEKECDFYARCGPNGVCVKAEELLSSSPCKCLEGFKTKFPEQWATGDWSGGCVRERAFTCDGGGVFSRLEKYKPPDHVVLFDNMTVSECQSECQHNCSCSAYAYVNMTETKGRSGSCLSWFGDLVDLVENHASGNEIYIRDHSFKLGDKGNANNTWKRRLVIAVVLSIAGLLVIISGCLLWKRTIMKRGIGRGNVGESLINISSGCGNNEAELPHFGLKSILAGTNNFSEANKLGEGGFGPVYKGILPENQQVAIKRLSKKSGQGHQEFMNELKLIAKLQHTNLVRLLGCCIEEGEMILIYEYMQNLSVDKFLFDPSEKTKLDWGTRFRIIEGIAQGVLYIHKYSRLKIIHRDLKASNILLDGTMNPKISDFGMARIFGMNQTEAKTNRVVGTYGYMSPEYALYGHFSEKSDVFSFGVLLLEIVSGKRNSCFYSLENSQTLACWAWELWTNDRGMEVIDDSMRETCRPDEALRCINVGLLCVQEAPADRPTMSSVIQMLQGNGVNSLPPIKEPTFSIRGTSSDAADSRNTITISVLGAR